MPGGSGSSPHAYVAIIIDPDKARHSSRNGVHDMYDPFGSTASRTFTNVTSLTLLALFQSVKRLSSDCEPRAIYGCLVRPRNPVVTVDEDGVPDPIQEQRAREMEQTYLLGEDNTTLLWSDRTVKLFFDTVQKPPWVLVILRCNPAHGRGDTPPRGPQVTLDTVGTVISAPPMPASPQATPITSRDIIAEMDRIERMKRRLEEEQQAINNMVTELGLEKDPMLVRARKRLRTSESLPGIRRHSRNIEDDLQGSGDHDEDSGGDASSDEADTSRNVRTPRRGERLCRLQDDVTSDETDRSRIVRTPRPGGRHRRRQDDATGDETDRCRNIRTPRRGGRHRRLQDDATGDETDRSRNVRTPRRGGRNRRLQDDATGDETDRRRNIRTPRRGGRHRRLQDDATGDETDRSRNVRTPRRGGHLRHLQDDVTGDETDRSRNVRTPRRGGRLRRLQDNVTGDETERSRNVRTQQWRGRHQ